MNRLIFNLTFRHNVCLIIILLFLSINAHSSVTMVGNRIIYSEGNSSINVEFKNQDEIPYAVQSWFDSGDENSTAENGNAPFIANPMLFRIGAGSGQIMRIMYTGSGNLPSDRESIFYFNFLQIPPVNALTENNKSKNQILVMLKNRVKVFYRPEGISGKLKNMNDLIDVERYVDGNDTKIKIINKSPFYLSLVSVKIKQEGGLYTRKANMISPYSKDEIIFKNIKSSNKQKVEIEYINDQGARIKKDYEKI